MAILTGIILLAFGLSLAVVWFDAFIIALKGLFVLLLLVGGGVQILIGYAARKAAREYSVGVGESQEPDGQKGKVPVI